MASGIVNGIAIVSETGSLALLNGSASLRGVSGCHEVIGTQLTFPSLIPCLLSEGIR